MQEKYHATLYKQIAHLCKLVLMLSFIVKIEKVDGVPQHDDMDGVLDKMRFLLIVFGVCQHDKPYEPQDPIYVMNGLKMLESVIFIEFVELD